MTRSGMVNYRLYASASSAFWTAVIISARHWSESECEQVNMFNAFNGYEGLPLYWSSFSWTVRCEPWWAIIQKQGNTFAVNRRLAASSFSKTSTLEMRIRKGKIYLLLLLPYLDLHSRRDYYLIPFAGLPHQPRHWKRNIVEIELRI